MTVSAAVGNPENQEPKTDTKEINFRNLEKKLMSSEEKSLQYEQRIQELENKLQNNLSDSDPSEEELVDKRALRKYDEINRKKMEQAFEKKLETRLAEKERDDWLKRNPDFQDIMKHADKIEQADPELADAILKMPDSFERFKLVYRNIKALNLHKPKQEEQSAQDRINQKKTSGHYQPSGIASPGYASSFDDSPNSQKAAYEKMQQLKSRMRI